MTPYTHVRTRTSMARMSGPPDDPAQQAEKPPSASEKAATS